MRRFLARLAHLVRKGRIEVLGFCLLHTHYHLLVRSVNGNLSEPLGWLQGLYTRRFNRPRGRDGTLTKGRFYSRHVDDEDYLRDCVRYIDQNPLAAGLAGRAEDWEFGSARSYLGAHRRPPWLSVAPLTALARPHAHAGDPSSSAYRRAFGLPLRKEECGWVERRLREGDVRGDTGGTGSRRGRRPRWMEIRARLADGLPLDPVPVSPDRIRSAVARAESTRGPWPEGPGPRSRSRWRLLEAGLLRSVGRLTQDEASRVLGVSRSTVRDLLQSHDALRARDAEYDRLSRETAILCLAQNGGVAT